VANPPNQTMRTTVETTYRTFGTSDIQDATALIQSESAAIDAKTAAIAANSRALVENEMIQKRKLYRSMGINAPKQVFEGLETIVTATDASGSATQGIKIGYKIVERTAGEIAKAAEKQLRGRAMYAGMGRAGGVQALRDILGGMGGTPLAGGAATALGNLNQAVADIRGPDDAAAAQAIPLIKLVNQNKKLFGRLARGGYSAGGVGDEVKALLAREDFAGAIERMRQADVERGIDREAQSRSSSTTKVARSLSAQEERIRDLKKYGLPSYLTGGTSISSLELRAQGLKSELGKPSADIDDIKFLTDSLKQNIDEIDESTKTYKSASEAVKFLEDSISKLGSLIAGPGGAALLGAAAQARSSFLGEQQLREQGLLAGFNKVAGLGRTRRQRILDAFGGSAARLSDASESEIAAVPGIGKALAKKIAASLAQTNIITGTGFTDAVSASQGGKETVKEIQDRVRNQISDLRREGSEVRGKAARESLTKRYSKHPEGSAAAAKMTSALERAEAARASGATIEAELHEAEAGRAQADLELIDRRMARDRYTRMRMIGGMKRFSGQVFGLGSAAISGDVSGLSGAGVGMVGNAGQLLSALSAGHIIKNGFAGAGLIANSAFFGGLALAGVGGLASAAYGRGSSFLNRADASAANFLPTYEGFAAANASELTSLLSKDERAETMRTSILTAGGYDEFGQSKYQALAEDAGGSVGAKILMERAAERSKDAATRSSLFAEGSSVSISDEEAAVYQQAIRKKVEEGVFEAFGPGKGNVTISQIGEAISASGRGFGTEFNVGARPEGMTEEMFGAGSAAAYANMRGLSVASVARLSSLSPRFGVNNYSEVPGLVGVGGFGFRSGARDSFIDTINERISQAALGGETPELAMRNRLYQGAVDAGGNKEQLANAYAGSFGNMGDFRRGMFKGAADFSKKLMLIKAISTGGSLFAADDLLAEQGPGFTEMDRLRDAQGVSPFMADAEMRFEGLNKKTREALMTSMASGGGDVKEEPLTPESYFTKFAESFLSKEESESERSVSEKSDMGVVSARFDSATSRFANAVQRFTLGVMR
jgi:hypothetical protein